MPVESNEKQRPIIPRKPGVAPGQGPEKGLITLPGETAREVDDLGGGSYITTKLDQVVMRASHADVVFNQQCHQLLAAHQRHGCCVQAGGLDTRTRLEINTTLSAVAKENPSDPGLQIRARLMKATSLLLNDAETADKLYLHPRFHDSV